MKKRTKLAERTETYYEIFMSISDEARKSLSRIAKDIGHTGRGQRRATISKYLCEMYEEQITFYPNLFMKTFEEPKWEAYFLRKNGENTYGTFKKIRAHVSYALYLSIIPSIPINCSIEAQNTCIKLLSNVFSTLAAASEASFLYPAIITARSS